MNAAYGYFTSIVTMGLLLILLVLTCGMKGTVGDVLDTVERSSEPKIVRILDEKHFFIPVFEPEPEYRVFHAHQKHKSYDHWR